MESGFGWSKKFFNGGNHYGKKLEDLLACDEHSTFNIKFIMQHEFILNVYFHEPKRRKMIQNLTFIDYKKMNVIESLGSYPNIEFYMWLRHQIGVTVPKQVWYIILKFVIEQTKLVDLIPKLIKLNVVLRVQATENIFSTVYFVFPELLCIDSHAKVFVWFDDSDLIQKLKFNLDATTFETGLVQKRNFFHGANKYVGDSQCLTIGNRTTANGPIRYFYAKTSKAYVGECVFGKFTGKGKLYSGDSDENYIGDFVDGIYCGFGTYYSADGSKYIGEFKNDQPNGLGTFYFEGGYRYHGYVSSGEFHGHGSHYDANNKLIYQGEFKNGDYGGLGTMYYDDGSIYIGEFKKDKPCNSGSCTFHYPDGRKFVGEYKNGKMTGTGELYDVDDRLIYQGGFKDGSFTGCGTYYHKNGSKYVGEFKNDQTIGIGNYYNDHGDLIYHGESRNGLFHGLGTYYYDDGQKYVGQFQQGRATGIGDSYNADNTLVYHGDHVNGSYHGSGTYYFDDGSKYVGECQNGHACGSGIYYYADGSKYIGKFEEGKKMVRLNSIINITILQVSLNFVRIKRMFATTSLC